LRRQIRIEGPLEEVSEAEADTYFHSRPRVSQIGSAASDQSRPLPDRQVYLDRVHALEERYPEGDIPRPAHWTGFRLSPRRIEFWQDRQYRLHDRRQFSREDETEAWSNTLLYP
ncbi:MAG: pyridoxal 5'-phosphate synthase, partial [Pseudomonadota bacterium]|nr:pyridoxal 5'-phosphate synthase [Pseudomonadota bacterium]